MEPAVAPVHRLAYEANFKLRAIEHAIKFGNRSAGREFKVSESMVRKWRKQHDKLLRAKDTAKSFRGHRARWPELEEQIERWVTEQRAAGGSVSTITIRLKATALACDMNIEGFTGGPSWCSRFMKRRNISIRSGTTATHTHTNTHTPPGQEDKLEVFRTYWKNQITDKEIPTEQITNMDQVPVTFDLPVNRTVETPGPSPLCVRSIGTERLSFTVVLSVQADGHKLPPMVIFKRSTPPQETFPAGVVVKVNPRGRMDQETMREWLEEVYLLRPAGFLHTSPSMLICDFTPVHLAESVQTLVEETNSVLVLIPSGFTQDLQPLERGVKRSFKEELDAVWERWVTGSQRWPSHALICHWVLDCWAQVSAFSVVTAFTETGLIPEEMWTRTRTSNKTDSDEEKDQEDPGTGDGEADMLLECDSEDEESDGMKEEK